MMSPPQGQQQQNPYGGLLGPALQGANGIFGSGASGGGGLLGGGSMSTAFSPALYAALIGMGKNIEAKQKGDWLGQGMNSLLGPDFNQVKKDPIGMGLPTLLGLPFITPWTANKASQTVKPEWSNIFSLGSNF